MKGILILLVIATVLGFILFGSLKEKVKQDLSLEVPYPTITPTPQLAVKKTKETEVLRSIFVPYWGVDSDLTKEKYDEYLYFGIAPGQNGINKKEAGFSGIDKFAKGVPEGSDTQLVLRMIDSENSFPILKDQAKQNAVIRDSISIAKEKDFDGIVLDLEISAVPFESLINQVNSFTKLFHEQTRKHGLEFTLMFYGDSFYRLRPFDIKSLSKNADKFMVMSYDFSKSRGNPGPNFPLRGKEVYGYDMTRMTDDFLRYLPTGKTSIVFGLYGYDWTVDDKGNPISQASPLTYLEIQKKFLTNCEFKNCSVKRKNDSKETEIRYTDEDNKNHIVWFEDTESVAMKQDFLKGKGIKNFSFWAYSYF